MSLHHLVLKYIVCPCPNDFHGGSVFSPMDAENIIEPSPPSAMRVARRALVLSVVSCRGFVEGDKANPKDAVDLAKRSHEWLKSLDLEEEITAWEAGVLNAPFGTLSDRDRIGASWLSEAVTVMSWALGRFELPDFDQQCDPAAAATSIGFLADRDETALAAPQLRSPEELAEYNEFIYHVHWRLRDYSLTGNRCDFESLARKAWGEPLLRHGLKLSDRDISIGGVPLSAAPEAPWRPVAGITYERHRASNWLVGYASEDFYEVTTDT